MVMVCVKDMIDTYEKEGKTYYVYSARRIQNRRALRTPGIKPYKLYFNLPSYEELISMSPVSDEDVLVLDRTIDEIINEMKENLRILKRFKNDERIKAGKYFIDGLLIDIDYLHFVYFDN